MNGNLTRLFWLIVNQESFAAFRLGLLDSKPENIGEIFYWFAIIKGNFYTGLTIAVAKQTESSHYRLK